MASRHIKRTVLVALALGALCGAAVGTGYASPTAGVTAAVVVGLGLAVRLQQLKRRRRIPRPAQTGPGALRS